MPEKFTPEQVASRTFSRSILGYHPGQVSAYLRHLAANFQKLLEQLERLRMRLGEGASRDLAAEFDAISREVGRVLEAAHAAAEGMRERAAADSARWRAETLAEIEGERRRARSDSEHLRSDAWSAAEELLKQVQQQVDSMSRSAEMEFLTIRGEAERQAKRTLSDASTEAEEKLRLARMEAEKLRLEAQSEHDEIIASARREVDAAQERARALERRRDELMEELTAVRSALARFEGELEVRQVDAGRAKPTHTASAPKPPKVEGSAAESGSPAQPNSDTKPSSISSEDWEPGGTVRVIPASYHQPTKNWESTTVRPDPLIQTNQLREEMLGEEAKSENNQPSRKPPSKPREQQASTPPEPQDISGATSPSARKAGKSEPDPDHTAASVQPRTTTASDEKGPKVTPPPDTQPKVTAVSVGGGPSVPPKSPPTSDSPVSVGTTGVSPADKTDSSEKSKETPDPGTVTAYPTSDPSLSSAEKAEEKGSVVTGSDRSDEPVREWEDSGSDLDSLFAQLRSDKAGPQTEAPKPESTQEVREESSPHRRQETVGSQPSSGSPPEKPDLDLPPVEPQSVVISGGDPTPITFEDFDPEEISQQLLLPLANRVTQIIKRRLLEAQNVVLEHVRVSEEDRGIEKLICPESIGRDLETLALESFASGHAIAMQKQGREQVLPGFPGVEEVHQFQADLIQQIKQGLRDSRQSGQSYRVLGSVIARRYRAWRSEEVGRRVFMIAQRSFQQGWEAAWSRDLEPALTP